MPVKVDEEWKARIRAGCPELPFDKQRRFFAEYQLPYTITACSRRIATCATTSKRREVLRPAAGGRNWIANDLLRELAAGKVALADCKMRPAHIAGLVRLVEAGVISNNIAKEVFVELFQTGEMPEAMVGRKGLKQSTDVGELDQWCGAAIAANPKSVTDFKAGKENAINAMKGFVMKQSKGKANPRLVDEICARSYVLPQRAHAVGLRLGRELSPAKRWRACLMSPRSGGARVPTRPERLVDKPPHLNGIDLAGRVGTTHPPRFAKGWTQGALDYPRRVGADFDTPTNAVTMPRFTQSRQKTMV